MLQKLQLLAVVGPTASGKTSLSAKIAERYIGEIISADSRQIYKGMDIGTGKDLDEYYLNGKKIPYHLINIITPNTDYSVYQFQKDFFKVYDIICLNKSLPILCGGTGLYIESVLLNYDLKEVSPNYRLRKKLEKIDHNTLIQNLKEINIELHNKTDLSTKKRTIRALEIARYKNLTSKSIENNINFCVIGIKPERKLLKKNITRRLKSRLKNGLIEEVKNLLKLELSHERLNYFGLEYKYIGHYLSGNLNYNDMYQKLNTAIHQYSKRQMTFFRRMEKRGIHINWINEPNMQHVERILAKYYQG
ncbi:MAG: tRNA (adenosine(37)-N6)-dimethylallyltransferase MiaA [Candidatus Neomarinimicrobiota bacterium]|jgi:tRNA dimethylallyltransferase|nr:tRNA (adenosine(37)-N6)-dimethylallyltransferase MiaA [Candidatus Neomarinimicrobiota bacterium]